MFEHEDGEVDEDLENVVELEEVSSILLLMFLYLAIKERSFLPEGSRGHSSEQADWVQSSIKLLSVHMEGYLH